MKFGKIFGISSSSVSLIPCFFEPRFSGHFALPMINLKDSSSIISNFFIPRKILFIVSLFTRMETPWFKYVLLTLCCTLYVQNVRKLIVVSDKINKRIDVSSNL